MAARKDYASQKRGGKPATPAGGKTPPPGKGKGKTAVPGGGKKPTAKKTVSEKKPLPVKLLLVTALMSAALVFFLYSLSQIKPGRAIVSVPVKPATAPPEKSKSVPVKKTTAPGPEPEAKSDAAQADKRFEFYQMLPKGEVTTSDPSAYKSTPRDAKSAQRYLLQAGSFRHATDAERLRAQLILTGLPNVHNQKTRNAAGETWYRVRTGPFDNRITLKKARDKLVKLKIYPLKVKVD
ncbi:MAG: SPOR domain-containing protein [Pontibacterium sp.]